MHPARRASLMAGALALLGAAAPEHPPLSEPHRAWLEEEVAHIISQYEHDAFLSLPDAARDRFIKAFWASRDPTPGTLANEFRDAHFRRIQEAETLFGHGTTEPGWKTARGKTWIQLGPPAYRSRYPMDGRLHPIELWFYQGRPEARLPRFFYVLFFKPHGVGDYRLYDPVSDGPEELVGGYLQTAKDTSRPRLTRMVEGGQVFVVMRSEETDPLATRRRALEELHRIDPELARAALTLRPDESPAFKDGRVAPGASHLLAMLEDYPNRVPVDRGYVERVLRGEVAVEYSFGDLAVRSIFLGARGADGVGALHYLIEIPPASLTLQHYGGRATGALQVVGRVFRDSDSRPVAQIDQHLEPRLESRELADRRSRPFAFADAIPLLPGRYHADLLVRDLLTRKAAIASGSFEVPRQPASGIAIGSLFLSRSTAVAPADMAPFRFGEAIRYPRSARFPAAGETTALVELGCAASAASAPLRLRYELLRSAGAAMLRGGEQVLDAAPCASQGSVLATIPLPTREVGTGAYTLRVRVEQPGAPAATRDLSFELTSAPAAPDPWILASNRLDDAAERALLVADQRLIAGDEAQAIRTLEAALETADPPPEVRHRLAALALQCDEPGRAIEFVWPLVEAGRAGGYELLLLGLALSRAGDAAGALEAYREASLRAPASTSILNALGEELERAGLRSEAVLSFRRSLSLAPDQKGIRARLDRLEAGPPR